MKQLLLFLLPLFLFAQEQSVVRIENASRETITTLYAEGYDITGSRVGKYCDIAVSSIDSAILSERYQLTTQVTGEELEIKRKQLASAVRAGRSVRAYDDPRYIDYDTYVQELNDLLERHPTIMKVTDLGKSQGAIQGTTGFDHRIWGIKVSDNVDVNEPEPGFLFVGETHARETQTFPVTLSILKELVENYETDLTIREYVDNNQLFFVPLLNPDGYTVATTDNSMWRKNVNSNGYSVSFQSYYSYTGVDLNRNYTYKWGENAPSDQTRETYRGPSPMSEPEVQAVMGMIEKEQICAAITFHSYSEVILMPYNQESNTSDPVDFTEMRALADKMAKVMTNKNGYGTYDVGNAVDLLGYGAGGGMSDHLYVDQGIFAYCFELWNDGFQTPENQLAGLARNARSAAKLLMDRGSYASLQGVITAEGEPIKAEIHVGGLDDNKRERNDYFSHVETGFYTRLLSPETYTVTITPEDQSYTAKEFDITIGGDSVTYLNVDFRKEGDVSLNSGINSRIRHSGEVQIMSSSRGNLSIVAPENGLFRVRLFSANGRVLYDEHLQIVQSEPKALAFSTGRNIIFAEISSNAGKVVQKIVLR